MVPVAYFIWFLVPSLVKVRLCKDVWSEGGGQEWAADKSGPTYKDSVFMGRAGSGGGIGGTDTVGG